MKYIILPLSLLASICSLHAAQSTTPAPAPVVCPPSKLAEAAAIRSYQLERAAGRYDIDSKLSAQGKHCDNIAFMLLYFDHLNSIPTDQLPAHCQAYIAETRTLHKTVSDKLKEGKKEDAFTMMAKGYGELNKKHPEAAKLMKDESAIASTIDASNIVQSLRARMTAAGKGADYNKIMSEVLAELAVKIRAAK